MKLEGSQVVLPGGLRVHVAVLGAIATILAALILVRGRGSQQGAVSSYPSATDQAIGALQTDISSLQGAVQQLQTPPPSPPTTSAAPTAPAPATAAAVWAALGNSSPTPSSSIADVEIGNLEWHALHPGAAQTGDPNALWAALGNTGSTPGDVLAIERGNVFYLANQGLLSAQQLAFIRQNQLVPGL